MNTTDALGTVRSVTDAERAADAELLLAQAGAIMLAAVLRPMNVKNYSSWLKLYTNWCAAPRKVNYEMPDLPPAP